MPYQLEEALNETSASLLSELRRSLTFFQSEYEQIGLNNCYLVGGGSSIIPMKTMLTASLNVTFRDISPMELSHKRAISSERYLAALGASLWN